MPINKTHVRGATNDWIEPCGLPRICHRQTPTGAHKHWTGKASSTSQVLQRHISCVDVLWKLSLCPSLICVPHPLIHQRPSPTSKHIRRACKLDKAVCTCYVVSYLPQIMSDAAMDVKISLDTFFFALYSPLSTAVDKLYFYRFYPKKVTNKHIRFLGLLHLRLEINVGKDNLSTARVRRAKLYGKVHLPSPLRGLQIA